MPQENADNPSSRLDRLESIHAIQQLAARYAVAVDSRDVDSWVQLFIEDVNCGRHGIGRNVLRDVIAASLRSFYRSIHFVGNHQIDLIDADHATGIVYCRAEHEVGAQWIVVPVAYFDEYERRHGNWYFVRRREKHWYSVDQLDRRRRFSPSLARRGQAGPFAGRLPDLVEVLGRQLPIGDRIAYGHADQWHQLGEDVGLPVSFDGTP